jgi:hypothetical protein
VAHGTRRFFADCAVKNILGSLDLHGLLQAPIIGGTSCRAAAAVRSPIGPGNEKAEATIRRICSLDRVISPKVLRAAKRLLHGKSNRIQAYVEVYEATGELSWAELVGDLCPIEAEGDEGA